MNLRSLFEQDRLYVRPEGFLIFTRSGLLVAGAVLGTHPTMHVVRGVRMTRLVSTARRIGSRLCRSSLSYSLGGDGNGSEIGLTRFDGARRMDASTQGGKARILLGTARCRRGSSWYSTRRGRHRFEYSWRMAVASLGLMRRRSGNDLRSRYLGLEWSSLCFYVLAAIRRGSAYSTEAGLKYFIMGAVSSGLYLFGASLIYGATGSLQFGEIGRRRADSARATGALPEERKRMRRRGSARVRIGFLFKLAIAPFHAWSPDVYEGSPSPSSLYFAVVPKRAMVRVILRLVYGPFAERRPWIQPGRRLGSMRSRRVAALAARGQRRRKRFRAYSAIGHMGYLLLGLSSGSMEGIQSARLYAMIYRRMSVSIWLGVMSVIQRSPLSPSLSSSSSSSSSSSLRRSAKYRTDLNGLHRRNAFLAAGMSLSVRSMAGIPPRAGFMPKLWVFRAAMSQQRVLFSLMAVLASCIGAYYYLRWIKIMYFDGTNAGVAMEYAEDGEKREREKGSSLVVDEWAGRIMGRCLGRRRRRLRIPGPVRLRTHRMALALILS